MKVGDIVIMSSQTIHVSEFEALDGWGVGMIVDQHNDGMLEVWWPKRNTTRSYGRHTTIIEVVNESD